MGGPLTDVLCDIHRTVRRAGIVRGASLLAVALIAGIVLAAACDFLIRPGGTAARLLLTAIAIAPALWIAASIFLPALRERISDIELARRIESQDPRWGGRLAAATSFLAQDPTVGSTELQRRVVDDVSKEVAIDPPREIVDARRLRGVVLAAVAVGFILFAFVCASPALARSGLMRLALPLTPVEWPRKFDLQLLTESGDAIGPKIQIGRGQTLRFKVRNRNGDVPDDLTLQVVTPDGRRRSEPIPVAEEPSRHGATRMAGIGSLYATEGPLRFRVIGGDHRNAPYVLAEVVPPPVFESIAVTVTPPVYLQQKPTITTTGGGTTSGIVGSTVSISAHANKPLTSAELIVGDRNSHEVALRQDGQTVEATFPLEQPGLSSFWFRLRDQGGFENPEAPRYELRVAADAVPTVTVIEPPDDLTATADAELPIVVEAIDDQGLASVRLRFGRDGLNYVTEDPAGTDSLTTTVPLFDGMDRPQKGTYPLLWSIGALELRPGDRLAFRGEAGDAYDLGPPHVGQSATRSITIVSAAEKREELLDRQSELLNELAQVRREEQRIGETVDSLLAQLGRSADLPAEQQDLLARSELEQRRIASRLADREEGLQQLAARALSELKANRLDDRTLADRLGRITTELGVLGEGAFPAADRDLTSARKAESGDATRSALVSAKGNVAIVLESLNSLLDDLGAWRNRRDLGIEANELLAIQRELREETAKTAAQTLGTISGQLTDQQTANLERLGFRQSSLAERLSRLAETVDRLADPSEPPPNEGGASHNNSTESAGPDRLKDAAELLRTAAMPATARAAGDSIRGNNLGEAGRLQRDLISKLQALKETLSQSDQTGSGEDALHEATAALSALSDAQDRILNELRSAAEKGPGLDDETRQRLSAEQSKLREDAATTARRLRSAASDAGSLVEDAAREMSNGLDRLRQKQDLAAERPLENAGEKLHRAEQKARNEAEQAERRSASQLAASSAEAIASLALRQAAVNEEVRRLDDQRRESGSLSRSQLLSLRKLVEAQREMTSETHKIAETLNSSPIVAFALQSAVQQMQRLETALSAKETGQAAQSAGEGAKKRLEQVASALGGSPPSDAAQTDDLDANQQQDETPSDGQSALVALRVLKILQQDVYERTQSLDAARSVGELSADQNAELKRLSEEQRMLSEWFDLLVKIQAQPAEETSQ